MRTAILLLLLILSYMPLSAQDNVCLSLVQEAVTATLIRCDDMGINTFCYGNGTLATVPRSHREDAMHALEPGEVIDLAAFQTIATDTFHPQTNAYGVSLLAPRTNLPDASLIGVMLGSVILTNESMAESDFIALDMMITHQDGANIRQQPDASSELVGTIYNGTRITAIGQTAENTWLRILLEADKDGWINAETVNADFSSLPVVTSDADEPMRYGPMQQIILSTGINDSPCFGVTDSALVLQTPELGQESLIVVNNVQITFDGTIMLQGNQSELFISSLEGQSLLDETLSVDIGEMAHILFNSTGDYKLPLKTEEYKYVSARYIPQELLTRPLELSYALGGVLIPYEPNTGYLSNLPDDAPCTIAWMIDVNFRTGPGAEYPIRRGIEAYNSAHANASAIDSSGIEWWRLAEDIWVSSEPTAYAGMCETLPLIAPPPLP